MYTRNDAAVFRSVADGAQGVILDSESGEYYSVNAVGAALWDLIDGERDTPALCAALRDRFPDAPADQVDADVREFVEQLLERGLITKRAAG